MSPNMTTGVRHIDPMRVRNSQWYGVQGNIYRSATPLIRVGNMQWHIEQPLHSMRYPCTVLDSGRKNYDLLKTDVTKKIDGSAANLDGTDGQCMVYYPEFWDIYLEDGVDYQYRMSPLPQRGWNYHEPVYKGMYKAALQRRSGGSTVNKLASVNNLSTDYRGGNDQDSGVVLDTNDNSLLGRAATSISRTNFRTYARNRGSNFHLLSYDNWRSNYWFYVVEYGNRNSQLAVNTALTREGFKQGGVGVGLTNLVTSEWLAFFGATGYFSPVRQGLTNSLTTPSGEVAYTIPGYTGTNQVKIPRYAWMESPFGDIWEFIDGINIYHQSDAEGGKSLVYLIQEPRFFSDVVNRHNILVSNQFGRTAGWIKSIIGGRGGDILPKTVGGSSTTYYADYNDTNGSTSFGLRAPLVSAAAFYGSLAGVGIVSSNGGASTANSYLGSRLCCKT
jgi:hypothetical protein